MSGDRFIPFHVPSPAAGECREAQPAPPPGALATGPGTAQFEEEFRAYVGAPRAIGVNSCAAALHLALAALDIGKGDEVITTPLTFCSTVHTILALGAKPVLADVGPDGNTDPLEIARACTPRTRAVIPMHFAGLPCDMHAIWNIARRNGLFVVEDAAQAAGSHYAGRPIGSAPANEDEDASDAVAFGLYGIRNMPAGEAGMVATHREELAARMRALTLRGVARDPWNRPDRGARSSETLDLGFKCNLTDAQSASGIRRLRALDAAIQTRTRFARIYNQEFAGFEELETPPEGAGVKHSWSLYVLRLNLDLLGIGRDDFIEELRLKGAGAAVHFIPVQAHPSFARIRLAGSPCDRAMQLYHRVLSLPLYPAMGEDGVRYVARCVKEIAAAGRAREYALRAG